MFTQNITYNIIPVVFTHMEEDVHHIIWGFRNINTYKYIFAKYISLLVQNLKFDPIYISIRRENH